MNNLSIPSSGQNFPGKKQLIKNLSIGLVPLFVFIGAEYLVKYNTGDQSTALKAGLAAALIFGTGAFFFVWIKERRIDAFILFDTALLMFLGGISLILVNPIFFKIKPALIEAILMFLVGITAFSDHPLLINMTKRYMQGIQFNQEQFSLLKRMMRTMFLMLFVHVSLIIYAAFFMSQRAWAFISGVLFYILLGVIMLAEAGRVKLKAIRINRKFKNEEWSDIVDQKGNVISKAPRSMCHSNPSLLHPVVHLQVFNEQGELYLQKRSVSKDIQPGKWDTAVGGHIKSGEDIESALLREICEELGAAKVPHEPLFKYIMQNARESEFVYAFRAFSQGPFTHPLDEIECGRFWRIKEIESNLGKNIFTPNFEQEFNLLKKAGILNR
ncbi:MAG: NUDIX domain-containing protein [bacterium]